MNGNVMAIVFDIEGSKAATLSHFKAREIVLKCGCVCGCTQTEAAIQSNWIRWRA